ncbi:molybdopterin biosynthesis protein MoeB [bacterium BMS3Abin15]|nr:molybdopterin biosynthesis protein MoeB [bacterium BMS3Abin15]HDH07508.1 hypothetical protein [Candidatus Moranbacteria bacterium]HDZ85679.1 hypothetical protein [Candidatus Moranbacteria bacterium]
MIRNKNTKEKFALLIGFVLILLVAAITFFRPHFGKKQTEVVIESADEERQYSVISARELQQKIISGEKVKIIDIRMWDDFQREHIVDSISVPFKDLSQSDIGMDNSETVVVIGKDDAEHAQAVKIIESQNYTKVFVLTEGVSGWIANGGQVISLGDPNSFIDQSKLTYVSSEDLKSVIDNNYPIYILDVRDQRQFSEGHISGASNIPLNELEKRRGELSIAKEILVYGETELQGFQAGIMLNGLNFHAVNVLSGGFASWKEKGFEIVQ